MTEHRTWFVTGASRGLGRAFVAAALAAGDQVAATVRTPGSLDALRTSYGERLGVLELDVTDRRAVRAVVAEAYEAFGRLDVVVNNAGYGLVGAIEEVSEEEARLQLETNLLGAVWVSQAAVPYLREQGSGHIIQISTIGAVGTLPLFGMYNASKWGLEGFSGALADEVAPFGVHVTIAELGGFATDWAGKSMQFATADPAYDALREATFGDADYPTREAMDAAAQASEEEPPEAAAAAVLALVDDPEPPRRIVIGRGAREMVATALEWRRDEYARDPDFRWPS